MLASNAAATSTTPPAATVLYEPDPAVTLAMLRALETAGQVVYIYRNGPVAPELDAALAALPRARLIRSPLNIGLGAALNVLMEAASADGHAHILLLDQDSTPAAGLADRLLAHLRQHEAQGARIAAIGPLLVPPRDEGYLPIRYAWRDEAAGTAHFLPTSGSLVSLPAFAQTGPFRGDYFVGGIDVEWGFRAWSHGFQSVVARDVELVHRWGTPVTQAQAKMPQILRHSDVRTYYYVRNAVDCLRLPHLPIAWKLRAGLTLAAQIGVLLVARRFGRDCLKLLGRALGDGLRGRLGPAPDNLGA